jgi:hypothetical protein
MNSIPVEGYISIDVENPKGGYHEPYVIITKIPNHKNCHSIRLSRLALKYFSLKKNVDPNAHEN